MHRTNSGKSVASPDASAEESYDPLPVTTVRHGAGDGAGRDGDAKRTAVRPPARNFSLPYPSLKHLNRRESAVSYHRGLTRWHRRPRCEYETGRNQQEWDLGYPQNDDKGEGKMHRRQFPFPRISGQLEQSQVSPAEDTIATDDDSDVDRRILEQKQELPQKQQKQQHIGPTPDHEAETSGGGKGHSHKPGGMTLELPPRFATPITTTPTSSSDDNLILQPYTLSPVTTPGGRRKLFSTRRVLFGPTTPTNTRKAASSRDESSASDSPLDGSAGRTAVVPSSSAPGKTGRVLDANGAGEPGRWQSWMAGHSNKDEDYVRTLLLSEFYSQRKDEDAARDTAALGTAAARLRTPRKRRKPRIIFAAMLALLALVVIGSWCAIIFEWRKHSSEQRSQASGSPTVYGGEGGGILYSVGVIADEQLVSCIAPAKTSMDSSPVESMSTTLDPTVLTNTQEAETANHSAWSSSSTPQSLIDTTSLDSSGENDSTVVYGKTIVTIKSSTLKDLTPTPSLLGARITSNTATSVPAEMPFIEDTRARYVSNDGTDPEFSEDGDGGGHPMVTVMRRDPKPHDEPDSTTTFVLTTYVTPPSREQEPPRSTHNTSSHTTTAATVPPQEPHPSTGTVTSTSTATDTRTHTTKVTTIPPGKTQAGDEEAHNSPTYCPFVGRPAIWILCGPAETGQPPSSSASGPAARNPLAGLSANLQQIKSSLGRVGTYATHHAHLVKAAMVARWPWSLDPALMLRPGGERDEVRAEVDCDYNERNRTVQCLRRDWGEEERPVLSPLLLLTSPSAPPEHHKDPNGSSRRTPGSNSVAREKAMTEARIADLRRGIETAAQLARAQLRILENQRAALAQQKKSIARAARTLGELRRARRAGDGEG